MLNPSKEAIEEVSRKLEIKDLRILSVYELLDTAYAIDVAPLELRIAELETANKGLLELIKDHNEREEKYLDRIETLRARIRNLTGPDSWL